MGMTTMRSTMFILLLCVFVPCHVRGETLAFPLSGFSGGFGGYNDSVVYSGNSVQVISVALLVNGVISNLGYQQCFDAPPFGPRTCTFGVEFEGALWINSDVTTKTIFRYLEEVHMGAYQRVMAPVQGQGSQMGDHQQR